MIKLRAMAKEPSRGIFWVVDGRLFAFPFTDTDFIGLAKSGKTYNHKAFWNEVRPAGKKVPYNYYPRGRVEFNAKGRPVIYVNPNVDEYDIKQVKVEFGLRDEPVIRYDYSEHYKCHLDDGWQPDGR